MTDATGPGTTAVDPAAPDPAAPDPAAPDPAAGHPAGGDPAADAATDPDLRLPEVAGLAGPVPLSRSLALERAGLAVVGALLLIGGLAAVVAGAGWAGRARATRPLIDPIATGWLLQHALAARLLAMGLAAVLIAAGIGLAVRATRTEPHPDLRIGDDLTITAAALADAVRRDAEQVDGVVGARARMVGTRGRHGLRLVLSLRDGADLREVWEAVDGQVLGRARDALGVAELPTAVHFELASAPRRRVR
jgi:hypothetical protein